MDILKSLFTALPTASLPVKVAFFATATALFAWYTFGFVPTEQQRLAESQQKLEAVSWYLGWNTMALLVPDWPKAAQVMPTMDPYLGLLGVKIQHPTEYYLGGSKTDGGARAQAYRELVYAQIMAKHGKAIAQYYGVATNLLQGVAPHQSGPAPPSVRLAFQQAADLLDLPPELRRVPDRDLLNWLNRVNSHFEARL